MKPIGDLGCWRFYKAEDKEAVAELHARMEERLGKQLDLPELDEEPVLTSLVKERDGKITNVLFLEAEAELCSIGEEPVTREEIEPAAEFMLAVCRGYKIRLIRSFVPEEALKQGKDNRPGPIERVLKHFGFVREDQTQFQQFVRWVE